MKKFVIRLLVIIGVVYIGGLAYMYFNQESFIFHPEAIAVDQPLNFTGDAQEINLETEDGETLNAILVKVNNPKGLVFYLHGNTGNLNDQIQPCRLYNDMGYDFFSFDYRTFGKSSGELENEEQFFEDVQQCYDYVKQFYAEENIRVFGYSVGTASAAMTAAKNNPKSLTLIAPYYSLLDMTDRRYKVIPSFLVKYPFETNKYLEQVKCPIFLTHGDKDEVLPFDGSQSLSVLLDESDIWLPIKGQGHDDFEFNLSFKTAISKFLN